MAEVALRPRTILEILDGAFALLRRDYLKFLTIMAIVSLPHQLFTLIWMQAFISATVGAAGDTADTIGTQVVGSVLPFLSWLLWFPFVDAALMLAASDSYLGKEVSVGDSITVIFRRFGALAVVVVLKGLAITFGTILLAFPGLYAFLRYLFAPAAVAIENRRGVEAMRRSAVLTKGTKWKILGAMALVYLIYNCLALLPLVPAMFMQNLGLLSAIGVVMSVLLYPMYPVTATLLYYDMRIRKEGFDIELLARELGQPPEPKLTR